MLEHRVLLRMGTSRDGGMTSDVLARAQLAALACGDMQQLVDELARGAGVLVVAEEAMLGADRALLTEALANQPPWSDLPLLMLARPGSGSGTIDGAIDKLPNVTVIERPIRVATLVSAVRSALRARERQYQVRQLLEDLRRSDQRKTEFLATLAHELRNPLAPIRNSLVLLSSNRLDAAATVRYHELMGRQVDHMVRLVDDLMEVSRITRGKIELHRVPVALRHAIREAVELSRPLVEAGHHTLRLDVGDDDLVVHGDTVRLIQVFSNLLNNAAKYTPRGGRLEIRVRRAGQDAVVEVSDSGAGLSADMLKAIFEMFVQASGSSKAVQGGLGIGLTLVRSLVELHGGSVVAASQGLGRGSTFTVRLPLLNAAAEAPAQREATPAAWTAERLDLTALVVDDNQDAADSLAQLLRTAGATVIAAYDGDEALELAKDRHIDVAILDIGMPGMDGCDLARSLRALPGAQSTTLIALTGWGQDRDRQRLAAAGFRHHLLKPADLGQLTALLRADRPAAGAG